MISIFKNETKKRSARKRSSKVRSNSSKKGEENLAKLNPMSFGILAVKAQENPNNEFLSSTLSVISEKPHVLTDKWINSINKFVDSAISSMTLDPPEITEGSRMEFERLIISKVVPPKGDSQYPMPALICMDKRGWKFYFKTSKAYDCRVGSLISFTATVSSHKDGITFLRRPSKIREMNTIEQGEA